MDDEGRGRLAEGEGGAAWSVCSGKNSTLGC